MQRYSIEFSRASEFYRKTQPFFGDCRLSRTVVRLNKRLRLQHMFDEWTSGQYGIPDEHQLLLTMDGSVLERNNMRLKTIEELRSARQNSLMICDIREVVMLSASRAQSLAVVDAPFGKRLFFGRRRLVALEYFDVQRQSFQCIQTLIVDRTVTVERLLHYVRNEFIFLNKSVEERRWHQQVTAVSSSELRVFSNVHNHPMTEIVGAARRKALRRNCMCFTFQLQGQGAANLLQLHFQLHFQWQLCSH